MSTIAICIGHSRMIGNRRDGGAESIGQVTEWEFNSTLAPLIATDLDRYRIKSVIVNAYHGNGYGAAMRWLADHLDELGVDAAIELHFNDGPATARGHEWLHWHSSKRGEALATALDYEMRLQLPPSILPARGIKSKTSTDRGAEFLRLTHCPAVICEPFFGSNHEDWSIATHYQGKIALAIANGIDAWLDRD